MKLYIVTYLVGKIIASVGPLPYGEDECRHNIIEMQASANRGINNNPSLGLEVGDLVLACEWHETSPR
jgi:hypothetical protein